MHDGNPKPLHEISIELTSKCNLTCKMCSVWKGGKDGISKGLVFSLLEEARSLGAEVFTPSGAENFMRKDLMLILGEAARLGYSDISVVTNGMLIKKHIATLSAIPSLSLHISIDGPQQVHDRLRGPGSYAMAIEGMMHAQKAGIPVSLKAVLMKPTLAHAGHLIDLAAQHGLRRVSFQPFQPEIAGQDEDHAAWIFPPDARGEVAAELCALLEKARLAGVDIYTERLFPDVVPYLFDNIRPKPVGGCELPARFILIDGKGDTFPCFFMRRVSMGNVSQGVRLRDIWHGRVQMDMQRKGATGACPGCLAGCSDVRSFDRAAPGRGQENRVSLG